MRGHHSAALDEHNWRAIATFVVEGTEPKIPNELRAEASRSLAFFARISWLVWLALISTAALLGVAIWRVTPPEWAPVAIVVYAWILWKILTRV